MPRCDHRWEYSGAGQGRVRCVRCGIEGTVVIDAPPPSHLEKARSAWNKSTEPWQTPADSAGFRADALGAVIQHLEEEERTR